MKNLIKVQGGEKVDAVQVKPRPDSLSIFARHSDPETEILHERIKEKSILPEVYVDEDNQILDGQATFDVCQKLGINPRFTIVTGFADEAERLEWIARKNCPLRSLGQKEKREAARAYLLRDPEITPHHLAEILGILDRKTVADERARMIADREIPNLTKLRTKDGKMRSVVRKVKQVRDVPARKLSAYQELAKSLPKSAAGKSLTPRETLRQAMKANFVQQRANNLAAAPEYRPGDHGIYHCDFRDLMRVANIRRNSVDLVLTDVPYSPDWIFENFQELCEVAYEVVKQSGTFVSYFGAQSWVQVGAAAEAAGFFVAPLTAVHYRTPIRMIRFQKSVITRWEPVLVAVKSRDVLHGLGNLLEAEPVTDLTTDSLMIHQTSDKEKDKHKWQKPLAESEKMVEIYSKPGQRVLDFCGGSFTNAEACYRTGRKFIGCDIDIDAVRVGQKRLDDIRLEREKSSIRPSEGGGESASMDTLPSTFELVFERPLQSGAMNQRLPLLRCQLERIRLTGLLGRLEGE